MNGDKAELGLREASHEEVEQPIPATVPDLLRNPPNRLQHEKSRGQEQPGQQVRYQSQIAGSLREAGCRGQDSFANESEAGHSYGEELAEPERRRRQEVLIVA